MSDVELYRIESLEIGDGEYTPVQSRALDSFAQRCPDAVVTGWLYEQHAPLIVNRANGDWLTITQSGHTRVIARGEFAGP